MENSLAYPFKIPGYGTIQDEDSWKLFLTFFKAISSSHDFMSHKIQELQEKLATYEAPQEPPFAENVDEEGPIDLFADSFEELPTNEGYMSEV